MNARVQHTQLVMVCLGCVAVMAGPAAAQQAASAPAQVIVRGQSQGDQPLSREQVDQILASARQAIEKGKLAEAETLVQRAESADVQYRLWHFGHTPATVRRELIRAQRSVSQAAQTLQQSTLSAVPQAASGSTLQVLDNTAAAPATPAPSRSTVIPVQYTELRSSSPSAAGSVPESSTVNPFELSQQPVPESFPSQAVPAGRNRQAAASDLTPITPSEQSGSQPTNPFGGRDLPEIQLQGGASSSSNSTSSAAPSAVGDRYGSAAPQSGAGSAVPQNAYSGLPVSSDPGQSATLPPGALPPAGRIGPTQTADAKGQVLRLVARSREALATGNLAEAERLAGQANALNVPESHFLPGEDRLSDLTWEIQQARNSGDASLPGTPMPPAQAAVMNAANDAGGPVQTNAFSDPAGPRFAQLPGAAEPLPIPGTTGLSAAQLLQAGERALQAQDRARALQLFREAETLRSQLDPMSRDRLQSHLQMLSQPGAPASADTPLIDTAQQGQQVMARQLSAEVTQRQSEANRIREEDPNRALEIVQETREIVSRSQVDAASKSQLMQRLDITQSQIADYIEAHGADISLEEQNRQVLERIEREREVRIKVREDIAELVDKFNQLRDEQRYEEMEIISRRLYELAPDEPVVQQVLQTSKFIRREILNKNLQMEKEEAVWSTYFDVERSSFANVGDDREMAFNPRYWEEFVRDRQPAGMERSRRTESELEIERRLRTPVRLQYEEQPLGEVINALSQMTGVNIHMDQRGMELEAVTYDTLVSLTLPREIQLQSALNILLEPLHLSYVVEDEVLKITSEQLSEGEAYQQVYYVADLVMPIPNFVPTNNLGMQGLLNDAYARQGYGLGIGAAGPMVVKSDDPRRNLREGSMNDQVLAQQMSGLTSYGVPSTNVPVGGPGGLGGGANADFDSLIDLIVSTIAPETWAENGGSAEVRPFPTNLSLVVSQTLAIHEQIADLLDQLRRLQDLQVTVEVRFIRLNDTFFERIGVDFDFNVEDGTTGNGDLAPGAVFEPTRPSAIVGLEAPTGILDFPRFTADLDIPFRQGSFGLTTPTFGGAGLAADAFGSFGYAILSDIEAFLLVEAFQGDTRTNVLNAPKVTLFNGQQAFVADNVQMPFVTSVIPIVGEFAAAQQPVIVVLSEGTSMTIQAVVSDDRRFVRLTVVPFFSSIGEVDTFTFEGSETSTSSMSSTDDDDDDGIAEESSDSETTIRSGTTVQLPQFQFVSVVTTVSVPDGGTVLLGGIKRLSEGRNEFGVPLLSKLPYINRLFKNVGIGRDTDSLMMMVTPRIIIQEEEERRLVGDPQ